MLALSALSLWTSTSSTATSPTDDFSPRWQSTPLKSVQGPHGTVEGRIFERFVSHLDGAFAVGQVSFFRFPKPKGASPQAFQPSIVAEQIRKAMGFQSWKHRQLGNVMIYEAPWVSVGRIVKLFIVDEPQRFSYSVSIYRTAYSETVGPETEVLQRQLAGVWNGKKAWLEDMTAWMETTLGVPPAYAACPACSSTTPASALTCSSCTQLELSAQITSTNSQLGSANNNWSTTNSEAVNQAVVSNSNWSESNNQVRRANDLLEKTLQRSSAFVLGAATAAGAVAGGMAMTLIVDGLAAGVREAYELITHEKEDAQRLASFEKAREQIEKLKPAMRKLEEEIDSSLYITQMAQTSGSREKLIAEISTNLRGSRMLSEAIGTVHQEALIHGNTSGDCLTELNREGARLDLLIEDSGKLLQAVRSQDHSAICDKMQENIESLIKAENELQSARLAILSGQSAWQTAWDKKYAEDIKNGSESDTRLSESLNKDVAGAKKGREMELNELKKDYEIAFRKCVAEKSSFVGELPLVGILFSSGTRIDCNHALQDPKSSLGSQLHVRRQTIEKAYRSRVETAEANFKKNQGTAFEVRPNALVNQRALEKYQDWIAGLRLDQDYQKANFRAGSLAQKEKEIAETCLKQW